MILVLVDLVLNVWVLLSPFLADRIAAQYDRLLASLCRPSNDLSKVMLCTAALRQCSRKRGQPLKKT